jgi:hypothetical protein
MVVQFQYSPADYRKRLESTQQNRRRRRREPSPYDDASLSSSSSFLKVDPTAAVVAKQTSTANRSSPFFVPESPTFLTHGYRRSKTPTPGDARPFWHHSNHLPEPRRAKSEPRASQQLRPPRPLLAAERFCDQEYLDSKLVEYRKTSPALSGSPNNHSNASSDQTRSNRANLSTNNIDTNTSFASRKSSPEIWIEPEFLTKKKNNKKHQKQVQQQQHLQKVLLQQYRHLQKQQEQQQKQQQQQQQQQRSQSAPKTITIPASVSNDKRHHRHHHRNPTTSDPRSYAAEYYARKRASSVPRKARPPTSISRERSHSPDPLRACVRTSLQYWGESLWSSSSQSRKNDNTTTTKNNTLNDPDSNIHNDVCCGGTEDVFAEDTPDASQKSRNKKSHHRHHHTSDHHLFFLDAKALADNLSASNVDDMEERRELDEQANKIMQNWTQCSPQNSCSPKQQKNTTRQRASPSRSRLTALQKSSSAPHRRKSSSSNHSILEDTSTSSDSHNTSSNNNSSQNSSSSSSTSSSDDMLPRPPKTFNTVRQSPSSQTHLLHGSQQPSPVSVADWISDQPGENWSTAKNSVYPHDNILKEDSSTDQRRRRRPLGVYEQTMTAATKTIASTPESKTSVPFDEAAKRAKEVDAFNKEIARFELMQREQQILFEKKHDAMSLKYARALKDLATQGESIQKLQKELKETTLASEQTRIDMLQYKADMTKRSQTLEQDAEQTFQERIEIEEKLRREMLANQEFKDQVSALKREVARLTVMLKFAREGSLNNRDDVPSILAASTSSGSESLPDAANSSTQSPRSAAANSAKDDEKNQQIERLMTDLLSLRSDMVDLRAQLADARAERLTTDTQMQQLKQDRDKAQEQVTTLNSALEKLQRETNDLKHEADATQQKEMEDFDKVKEELALVRKQLEKTNQQTGLYAEKSQKLQEELTELQAEATKHQVHAANLLRQLEETRSEADEKVRVSDMETKKLQDEVREMKEKLSQTNSEMIYQATEHLQERKRIEQELEKTREIAQVLQSKVVSLDDHIAQTESVALHSHNQGEGDESKATGLNPASLIDMLWKKF